MRPWLVLACALAACGNTPGDDPPGGGPDGGGSGPDAPPPPSWSFRDVVGVPNLDDDDGSQRDWDQAPFDADDDLVTMTLPASSLALATGEVRLSVAAGGANVRIYRDGTHVLGAEAAGPYTFTPPGGDVAFRVELRDYAAAATLSVERADTGEVATMRVFASPLALAHHLQPAEHVWAVRTGGNGALVDAFATVLGSKFSTVSSSQYGGDVWMQDEVELASLSGDGARIDVAIDSIRNRGLDDFPEDELVGPDAISQTWGAGATRTTYDSFGNLETSPPVTVDGVEYPLGRVYYGLTGSTGLVAQLRTFLASQRIQKPFAIPTTWLCVGHVDEILSTVPDPSSARGWKLAIADVPSAWEVLGGLSPNASIGRYGSDHGYPSVGSMLNDPDLRALNDDLQADYLDPILATMKAELGLDESDIIRVPSLFERAGNCGGRVVALIPGMVNLVVASVDGQTTHIFTADPFFRGSGQAQSSDPLIAAFRQRMPAGLQLHFVDDWYEYHLGMGEVHCATNVRRTPTPGWWNRAGHLLEQLGGAP
jgi:protein-arginine deiminase